MTRNMGTLDRTLRLFIALLIAALYVTDRINGTLAIVLGLVAVIFFATSLMGWCGLYALLGLSTRRDAQSSAAKA